VENSKPDPLIQSFSLIENRKSFNKLKKSVSIISRLNHPKKPRFQLHVVVGLDFLHLFAPFCVRNDDNNAASPVPRKEDEE
jgi:hypothetical protein